VQSITRRSRALAGGGCQSLWALSIVSQAGLFNAALAGVIYFVPMTRFIDSLSERCAVTTAAEYDVTRPQTGGGALK
jgi:hypothetical protein